MNGFGQQISTPEQLAQALQAYNVLGNRQETQQRINSSGNPYAMLGAALGGAIANKFGKYKGQNMGGIEQQIEQYNAEAQARIEAAKEARRQREDAAKWKRQRDADKEDMAASFENQKAMASYNASLRVPEKESFNERMYNSLNDEQKQAYANKFAGIQQQGPQVFTPEEQALIEAKQVTPEQLLEVKKNKALGIKDQSVAEKKKELAREGVLAGIQNLRQHVQEKGTEYVGGGAKSMKTAYTDLLMRAKDAYEMGALAGPDLSLLQELISDPTSIGSNINVFTGASNILSQLDEAEKIMSNGPAQPKGQLTQQGMQQTQDLLNKYLK